MQYQRRVDRETGSFSKLKQKYWGKGSISAAWIESGTHGVNMAHERSKKPHLTLIRGGRDQPVETAELTDIVKPQVRLIKSAAASEKWPKIKRWIERKCPNLVGELRRLTNLHPFLKPIADQFIEETLFRCFREAVQIGYPGARQWLCDQIEFMRGEVAESDPQPFASEICDASRKTE